MQKRLGEYHSEDILPRRSVAFMHGHFLGTPDQGGDHDQYIIEHGDGDEYDCHEKEHIVHILHILVIIVDVLQREDGVRQVDPGFLQSFHILVALLHALDGRGQSIGIGTGHELHVSDITVVSQPVGRAPFGHSSQ
ncbi:hypothetical protein [uncultured Parabacteroides sp.]|uniref:hypothetical protein n=1 Tax=uncultured Parabacteroides sp. TaxID=512312 RepID=UPI0025CE3454|nr:hypothetical protein [uncultured Parabacteroides sp.]